VPIPASGSERGAKDGHDRAIFSGQHPSPPSRPLAQRLGLFQCLSGKTVRRGGHEGFPLPPSASGPHKELSQLLSRAEGALGAWARLSSSQGHTPYATPKPLLHG